VAERGLVCQRTSRMLWAPVTYDAARRRGGEYR
jgi:hypothetical protein